MEADPGRYLRDPKHTFAPPRGRSRDGAEAIAMTTDDERSRPGRQLLLSLPGLDGAQPSASSTPFPLGRDVWVAEAAEIIIRVVYALGEATADDVRPYLPPGGSRPWIGAAWTTAGTTGLIRRDGRSRVSMTPSRRRSVVPVWVPA